MNKRYVTRIKMALSHNLHLPMWAVSTVLHIMSLVLAIIFTSRTIIGWMLVVGVYAFLMNRELDALAWAFVAFAVALSSAYPVVRYLRKWTLETWIRISHDAGHIKIIGSKRALAFTNKRRQLSSQYLLTRGDPRTPWSVADNVFSAAVPLLILMMLYSRFVQIGTFVDWLYWVSYLHYLTFNLVLLDLPQSVLNLNAPSAVHGLYGAVALQLLNIVLSVGLVSSLLTRHQRSLAEQEVFRGSLVSFALYLDTVASEHLDEVTVVDCGVSPTDVLMTESDSLAGREIIDQAKHEQVSVERAIAEEIQRTERRLAERLVGGASI